jgi:hypothetical protein
MKIRRRTADAGKSAMFTFVYEAILEGRVIAKAFTKYDLNRKLKELGYAVVG